MRTSYRFLAVSCSRSRAPASSSSRLRLDDAAAEVLRNSSAMRPTAAYVWCRTSWHGRYRPVSAPRSSGENAVPVTAARSARSYSSLLSLPGCSERASSMTARSASTCVRGDTDGTAAAAPSSSVRARRSFAPPASPSSTTSSARTAQSLRVNVLYCSPRRSLRDAPFASRGSRETRRSPRQSLSLKNLSRPTMAVRHTAGSLPSTRTQPNRRSTPSAGSLDASVLTATPSVAASLRPMASAIAGRCGGV